jgi:tRNA wybutosine-synthesizing protein 3
VLDSIIGYCDTNSATDHIVPMVSEDYLRTMVDVANQRFKVNRERTERFRNALLKR